MPGHLLTNGLQPYLITPGFISYVETPTELDDRRLAERARSDWLRTRLQRFQDYTRAREGDLQEKSRIFLARRA